MSERNISTATFHHVVVAVGSNYDAVLYIAHAQHVLREQFLDIRFSKVVVTKAIGMEGSPPFQNFLAAFETAIDFQGLNILLKNIESDCGRDSQNRKEIPLDIDILSYDGVRYHEQDWNRAYIHSLFEELNANA